jgi:hypothetical protein
MATASEETDTADETPGGAVTSAQAVLDQLSKLQKPDPAAVAIMQAWPPEVFPPPTPPPPSRQYRHLLFGRKFLLTDPQ